jgi:predicted dehydrogenase
MKYLVVGFCGSMGRRRVRSLRALGISEIYGYDISSDAIEIGKELGIENIENLDGFVGNVVISTPPKEHISYVKKFISMGCNVFCEASVVPEDRYHYEEIKQKLKNNNCIFFPSATIKFKDSTGFINKSLEKIGEIYSYDYRFAQNLRTWHPYQDIKDFYVSDPKTGAGREMAAFELSWLTYLFGVNSKILGACVGKLSEISHSTDIEDIYCFIIKHPKTIGSVIIDVFSHKPYRVLRISGSNGNIEFNWMENYVRIFDNSGDLISEYSEEDTSVHSGYTGFSTEKMYIEEMKNFIESTKDFSLSKCNIDEDYTVLSLVEEIERAGSKK